MPIDFKGLAANLLSRAHSLVPQWLPGGKFIGKEYCIGNIHGGEGDSLRINVGSGQWADFADSSTKGGDLISLYAAINCISQGDAAKRLSEDLGINYETQASTSTGSNSHTQSKSTIEKPPKDAPTPTMVHPVHGKPSMSWCYKDEDGSPMFWIARYETNDGKQVCPWSWDGEQLRYVMKGWPAPRPLFGLEILARSSIMPVMIVEGEKACIAARKIVGNVYQVTTWPNGAQAINKVNWNKLFGRKKILIWPDGDEPGMEAAKKIAEILKDKCEEIKVIATDKNGGWDAADALEEGFNWDKFATWAKPLLQVWGGQEEIGKGKDRNDGGTTQMVEAEFVPAEEVIPIPEEPPRELEVHVDLQDDIAPTKSAMAIWSDLGLALSKSGVPLANADNCLRVLEAYEPFKQIIWFDEFHKKFFTKWNTGIIREWTEVDELNLMTFYQRELGLSNIKETLIHQACVMYAIIHKRNEPREWMESLTWDGIPRIENLFSFYFGAQSNDYIKAVSENFMISLAARVYKPGCKLDNMVILEGAQGMFKSTALEILGGPWFAENHEPISSKDFYLVLQGKLIVEISEMDAFSKADVTTIKKVITCHTDRFRPPFGLYAMDYPRQCVFVGTTNEHTYLRDDTGGRRFWPVRIGVIDIKALKEDREQLFAEAVNRLKAGDDWYHVPDEAAHEQEMRRQIDEWETEISHFIMGKEECGVTTHEILRECIGQEEKEIDVRAQGRVNRIMRRFGWEIKIVGRHNKRIWFKKQEDSTLV